MSDILFVTWDGGGNVPPATALAHELVRAATPSGSSATPARRSRSPARASRSSAPATPDASRRCTTTRRSPCSASSATPAWAATCSTRSPPSRPTWSSSTA